MNIALLGYGRMGRAVAEVSAERGHTVALHISSQSQLDSPEATATVLGGIDCCIDFTTPEAAPRHIRFIAPLGIPLVVGTTGWHAQLPQMSEYVIQHGGTLFHASNFSIGAHILLQSVSLAAALLNRFPDYDVAIHEVHHRLKKDAPSGTALLIAQTILEVMRRKTAIVSSLKNGHGSPNELLISSSRVGEAAGTHTVSFVSASDSLQLIHTANNRRGFAVGAVAAAEWVVGRKGVFTMEDLLSSQ